MPRHFLIIDGYNLIHAAGMAKHQGRTGELEQSRDELIHFLASYLSTQERSRTTIVFDAINAPGTTSTDLRFAEMKIRYPVPGTDADTEIETIIARHSSPRQILVVSGDRRLQKAIRKRRGRFVGSTRFYERLLNRGDIEAQLKQKNFDLPKEKINLPNTYDISYWMAVFSDIDVEDQEAKSKSEIKKSLPKSKKQEPSRELTQQKKKPGPSPEEELKMWEQRIADLYEDEGKP